MDGVLKSNFRRKSDNSVSLAMWILRVEKVHPISPPSGGKSHSFMAPAHPLLGLFQYLGIVVFNLRLCRHMFMGHDMSVSDFDGRTPLHLAAAEGHYECVKFLLQSCDVPPEPTDR